MSQDRRLADSPNRPPGAQDRPGSGLEARPWRGIALPALLCVLFAVATLSPAAVAEPEAWNRFGGPAGNFTVDADGLATQWPEDGPPRLWENPLGPGYSSVAASSRAVYTMHRDGDDDIVSAFDAATGKSLWTHRYSAPARDGHGTQFGTGPNAAPLLLEDRLVTLGYAGELRALDLTTGKLLWRRHLLDQLGGEVLRFGYSAAPISYRGAILVLAGGKAGVVALDPASGQELWTSAPTSVSYASPVVVGVGGRDQLLYFAADALHAIDPAEDGAALWSVTIKNGYANHASMPIAVGGDRLWVVSQQEAGARVLQLRAGNEGASAQEVWSNKKIRIHHWNSVRIGDTVYGTIGDGVQILAGIDLESGKILWRDRTFGKSNLLSTPAGTILLNEEGELALVELSPTGMKIRSRVKISDGVTWSAPTLVGNRLFVRDKKRIQAFDIGAAGTTAEKTGTR